MSCIKYKLSELLSKQTIDEINTLTDKIRNCGNDTVIIDEDILIDSIDLYKFLLFVHSNNFEDKNKDIFVRRNLYFGIQGTVTSQEDILNMMNTLNEEENGNK